jgi:serine/threonine-protein kinase RsbW
MGSETSSHSLRGSAQNRRVRPQRARAAATDVRLTLPARPDNVAVIRHVLGAFAESLQLSSDVIEDMRLAVTEACTNVVRHAYTRREPGLMDIVIRPHKERLELIVSDRGRGLGRSPDMRGPGLGLPLIAALADEVDIQHAPMRGSRVVMTFRRGRE